MPLIQLSPTAFLHTDAVARTVKAEKVVNGRDLTGIRVFDFQGNQAEYFGAAADTIIAALSSIAANNTAPLPAALKAIEAEEIGEDNAPIAPPEVDIESIQRPTHVNRINTDSHTCALRRFWSEVRMAGLPEKETKEIRDARLRYISAVIGRRIKTASDMTTGELNLLASTLGRGDVAAGWEQAMINLMQLRVA